MKIYLIGYMGSGKSTLGHDLAKALGISWTDLDDEFELRYKISIPDFFTKYGEIAFRELEHKLVKDIASIPDIVVSTGGGTPCYFNNMELMNNSGLTIYLEASPELILSRISASARKRPVFQKMNGEDSLQQITEHLKTRLDFYEKAKIKIDASKTDIQEMKELVLNFSEKLA